MAAIGISQVLAVRASLKYPSNHRRSLPPSPFLKQAPQSFVHCNETYHDPKPLILKHGCKQNHILAYSSVGKENNGGDISNLNTVEKAGEVLSTLFPLWVGIACVSALARPSAFLWIRGTWQITGLTLTMLGMGMTLSMKDFQGALAMPKEMLGGVLLQYTIMPTAGALISKLLNLPSYYAAGLILVACCPGGTASNVVTYIAKGNVALSVLMTATSTILAVVMTPLLTAKLAGQYVAVDAKSLFLSTVQVVLLPVLSGALMNHFLPKLVRQVSAFTPLVAVVAVSALCGSAIAQNATAILSSGGQVILAVCLLHAAGFFFGFLLSKLLGFDSSSSRTISIEVGMQNSVLGVVLAGQHFSNPLSAVPCAVSSVCHSIFGSALAGYWRLASQDKIKIEPSFLKFLALEQWYQYMRADSHLD